MAKYTDPPTFLMRETSLKKANVVTDEGKDRNET